jgi:hypothetical protein
MRSINRTMTAQAGLSKKQDPISKIIRAKRAAGQTQAVEHLLSKSKAPISNHITTKRKKRKKKEIKM